MVANGEAGLGDLIREAAKVYMAALAIAKKKDEWFQAENASRAEFEKRLSGVMEGSHVQLLKDIRNTDLSTQARCRFSIKISHTLTLILQNAKVSTFLKSINIRFSIKRINISVVSTPRFVTEAHLFQHFQ